MTPVEHVKRDTYGARSPKIARPAAVEPARAAEELLEFSWIALSREYELISMHWELAVAALAPVREQRPREEGLHP